MTVVLTGLAATEHVVADVLDGSDTVDGSDAADQIKGGAVDGTFLLTSRGRARSDGVSVDLGSGQSS